MDDTKIVDSAITTRRSVRAFLDKPVAKETLMDILKVASRAPSGNNTQPWQVIAVTGDEKIKLSSAILAEVQLALEQNRVNDKNYPYEYDYYPQEWIEPFLSRRRKVGFDLYAKLGITREDLVARHKAHQENFVFFGAPVGLLILMNRVHGKGAFIDMGMFLENIAIAARARGLDTCAQAVFSSMYKVIYKHLNISPDLLLICGMSLGYADNNHPANQLITERSTVDEFTQFLGF